MLAVDEKRLNLMVLRGGIKTLILGLLTVWMLVGCANAGKDQSVESANRVTLDGSKSRVSFNGEIKKYHWKQIGGKKVKLSDKYAINPTFIAPTVTKETSLTFRLTTVEKGGYYSPWKTDDEVNILVKPSSETPTPPNAIAEVNATSIKYLQSVTFDASRSTDSDGQIVSYQWLDETNTTLSNQKSFSYTFDTSGEHTITLLVTDDDAEVGRDSVTVQVEALLTSVEITAATLTLDVNDTTTLTATAYYNDNTSKDVTSSVLWNTANTNIFSIDANGTLKALKSGSTQLTAQVGTVHSNSLNITVNTPITLQSLTVTPNPVELRIGKSIELSTKGRYSDGSTQVIDVADFIVDDPTVAVIDPTGTLEALKVGSTSFRVKVGSVYSDLVFVTVGKELNTTNFSFTNFGSTYTNQIPVNATLTQYDEKRFCMIAGQILSEDGSPLQGVQVSIHKHPEYGTVLTDSNGTYVIPAEGGLHLTMRYSKQGYTTIDRKVYAPVQDWVRSPDVTMLQLDSKVTQIDLTSNTPQLHSSSIVTDSRGSRATTLVFDGISRATVTMPNGAVRILTDIAVRATEFKTPKSMPSDLPKESAFTYCSDLSIDGVTDDEEVTFDAPVVMYVDNFLGFEVGEIVPVGYYDRNAGTWKASDNGVVVKLLDVDNDGTVDALDATGDDQPNDLDGDGDFTDEVAGLQNNPNYEAGKSYWRAEMMHFTPWDYNWPWGPPWDASDPNTPKASSDDEDIPGDSCKTVRSYVTTKSRTFHEDIPIAGTDITLHYSSKRVGTSENGRGYTHTIDVSLDTTNAPASVSEAYVKLEIAGKIFKRSVTLEELNTLTFNWDGKDASGKNVSGEVTAKITAVYKYNLVYLSARSSWSRAWARAGGSSTNIIGRSKIEYDASKTIILHVENTQNDNVKIANGWNITSVKNPSSIRKNKIPTYTISSLDGHGGIDVVVDTKGNIYYTNSNQIKMIDTNGNTSIYAGTGQSGFSGDGGLAINATFKSLYGLGIDKSDNIYIFDLNFRLRKIDARTGIITTFAGNGTPGFSGDGGLATEASLNYSNYTYSTSALAHDIAEDSEGNIYFPDYKNQRIRKIDTNGIISTIAGTGQSGFSGDGALATNARLNNPTSIDSRP